MRWRREALVGVLLRVTRLLIRLLPRHLLELALDEVVRVEKHVRGLLLHLMLLDVRIHVRRVGEGFPREEHHVVLVKEWLLINGTQLLVLRFRYLLLLHGILPIATATTAASSTAVLLSNELHPGVRLHLAGEDEVVVLFLLVLDPGGEVLVELYSTLPVIEDLYKNLQRRTHFLYDLHALPSTALVPRFVDFRGCLLKKRDNLRALLHL